MSWMSLALTLVKLGLVVFEFFRNKALEQAGENRQALKTLQAMNAVSVTLKEVEERHAKMSDAEIRAEIEGQGDFRD